jgi:hypothetical protein
MTPGESNEMNHKLILLTLFALALLAPGILSAQSTHAAPAGTTFTVNVQTDGTDALPDTVCETAQGNGICTLRAAIMESNAQPGVDIVQLPAGLFVLSLQGADEDNGFTGDLDVTDSAILKHAGGGVSTIDGNGIDRVLETHVGVTLELSGMTITGGDQSPGAGILNHGTLWVTSVLFRMNPAAPVGSSPALYNQSNGTVHLERSTFEFNPGGAISNFAVMMLKESSIRHNSRFSAGGGILNAGSMTIETSTISDNDAWDDDGGGIANNGHLSVYNSTVSQNRAGGGGGGIRNSDNGTVNLHNVTVTRNSADHNHSGGGDGGGIFNAALGTFTLRNSIVAANHDQSLALPPSPKPHDCSGSLVSEGYNLVGVNTGCSGLSSYQNGDQVGTPGAAIEPQLSALVDNGGYTLTHAPSISSLAVYQGNPNGCFGSPFHKLLDDQRGYARYADGNGDGSARCDIGAVEYGAAPLPPQCNAKPDKATLKKPADGTSVTTARVKLNWNDVPCAETYKARVKRDAKDGPSADKKNGLTKSKYKTDPLDAGHTYYWRVIACNQLGCNRSGWKMFILE